MSTKKIRGVRHQVLLQRWKKIIVEQSRSGQSIRSFCRERKIEPGSFYYWLRLIRESLLEEADTNSACLQPVPADEIPASAPALPPVSFVSVANIQTESPPAQPVHPNLRLHCGRFELDVYADTPPELLRSVLSIMQEVHLSCS